MVTKGIFERSSKFSEGVRLLGDPNNNNNLYLYSLSCLKINNNNENIKGKN